MLLEGNINYVRRKRKEDRKMFQSVMSPLSKASGPQPILGDRLKKEELRGISLFFSHPLKLHNEVVSG